MTIVTLKSRLKMPDNSHAGHYMSMRFAIMYVTRVRNRKVTSVLQGGL